MSYRILVHPDYADHGDLADALDDREEFQADINEADRSKTFILPSIEMEEKEFAVTQEEAADDPDETEAFGMFRIDDYGTSSSTGNFWYRGFMFQVSQQTEVTHLISAVTSGGSATVVLYTAEEKDGSYTASDLLGYAKDVPSTGSEVETEIIAVDGSSTVTLTPGNTYLLAQTANNGQHVYVQNLNISDLETHPRILENSWIPRTNNSIRWNGSGDEKFIEGKSFYDLDGAMPRIGFLFDSDINTAVVSTLEAERIGNQLRLHGEVTLFFQYSTNKNVNDGTLVNVGSTTTDNTSFEYTFEFDPNESYYYRAYVTNEGGKSFGDIWRAGATAMGSYSFGEWEMQITGGAEATEYTILFDASSNQTVQTQWNSSTSTLTVRYHAGVSTMRNIENAVNTESAVQLNALVLDPGIRDYAVPPSYLFP